MKMKEGWLKCSTDKGMFPDELTVTFKDSQGDSVGLFCPKEYVDSDRIKIYILDENNDKKAVRLPVESPTGGRVVVVPSSEVAIKELA